MKISITLPLTGLPAGMSARRITGGTTDVEKQKHLLLDVISPLGTKSAYTYDAYGNPLTTAVSDNNGHITETAETASVYMADGKYIASQTDARGKTVTTVTDTDKGTTESVTGPNGQQGAVPVNLRGITRY